MPDYLVQIEGRNFLVEMEGRVARHGFITFRIIQAADPRAAELAAVQMIRATERLREMVRNPPEDPPVIEVTSIEELESLPPEDEPEPGFIWYEENPRRWWQFWRRSGRK